MRLFVAVPLPAAVREALAERAAGARARLPAARWVPAANLHLTLRFLGETGEETLAALDEALAGCFRPRRAFRLRAVEAGCFPPRRPGRVAWVGFAPCPELLELQAAVEATLTGRLGIPAERRSFHPHLTLARPRRPWPRAAVEAWREAFRGSPLPEFEVAAGHLVRSHLGPAGARYETLGAYPLEGGGRTAV